MKRYILLVDDDNTSNFINRKCLKLLSVADDEIHTALDGEKALTLINDCFSATQVMPNLILLDLNMPIMDGFNFIQAFNELVIVRKTKTLIVVVTSSTNIEDKKKAAALGIAHYESKPISPAIISGILETIKYSPYV